LSFHEQIDFLPMGTYFLLKLNIIHLVIDNRVCCIFG